MDNEVNKLIEIEVNEVHEVTEVTEIEELDLCELNYKKIGIIAKQDNLEDTLGDILIMKLIKDYKKGTVVTNNKKMTDFYMKSDIKKDNIFRRYSFLLKSRFHDESYFLLDSYQITNNQVENLSDNLINKKITFISSYDYVFSCIKYDFIIITTNLYKDELKTLFNLYLNELFDNFTEFMEFLDELLEELMCLCINLDGCKLSFIDLS